MLIPELLKATNPPHVNPSRRPIPSRREPIGHGPERRARPAPTAAFTAVELLLVVVALGLAAYIGAFEIRQWRHRASRDEIVSDLRQFAGLFQAYRAEKGEWPPATNPELRLPRGMEAVLTPTHWAAGPSLGGSYDWTPPSPMPAEAIAARPADGAAIDANASRPAGAAPARPAASGTIELTAFSPQPPLPLTDEDLRYIDRQLDDGDLATGRFRRGYNGWPVYFVDAAR